MKHAWLILVVMVVMVMMWMGRYRVLETRLVDGRAVVVMQDRWTGGIKVEMTSLRREP